MNTFDLDLDPYMEIHRFESCSSVMWKMDPYSTPAFLLLNFTKLILFLSCLIFLLFIYQYVIREDLSTVLSLTIRFRQFFIAINFFKNIFVNDTLVGVYINTMIFYFSFDFLQAFFMLQVYMIYMYMCIDIYDSHFYS